MRYLIAALIFLTTVSTALAQGRPVNVDVDEIETVRLGEEGNRVLRFRTEHPGQLRFDVFNAPESAGAITVTFSEQGADDETKTEDGLSPIVAPGRYEALVRAANPGEAEVQLRVWLDLPMDEFEANNSREDAYRIDLPFEGLVHLRGEDRDWFRVETHSGGVLGVHLQTPNRPTGPRIAVYDHRGEQIFLSELDDYATEGVRYVQSTGRAMYVEVWDTNNWGDRDADLFKQLRIAEYFPAGAPASSNAIVTLSLAEDPLGSEQLRLIGQSIDVDTVDADEADIVAQELREVIEGRSTGGWGWLLGLLVVLLLAGAGAAGYWIWKTRGSTPAAS